MIHIDSSIHHTHKDRQKQINAICTRKKAANKTAPKGIRSIKQYKKKEQEHPPET
jgi:hypothetical protein